MSNLHIINIGIVGYARRSKPDGSQLLDLRHDALAKSGVRYEHIYNDSALGKKDDPSGLASCLKALRSGEVPVVRTFDRLGCDFKHLVRTSPHASDDRMEKNACDYPGFDSYQD